MLVAELALRWLRRRRLVAAGAVAAMLLGAGCSPGFTPLNRPALRLTNPRSVAAPKFLTPTFRVNTGGGAGALFGLVGMLVVQGMDERTLHGHLGFRDPATFIRANLVAALAKRFSLEVVDIAGNPIAAAANADGNPAARRGPPDLVLEIQTDGWGVVTAPGGGAGATYDGTMRLRDLRTNKILAEAFCSSHPAKGEPVGELAADDGADLRNEVQGVTEFCTEDYRHRVLGLY